MKDVKEGEFGEELRGLERRLRRADLSGESLVKDTLKERLLDPERRPRRRAPALAWLVPAAAVAAALFLLWPRGGRDVPASLAAAPGYALADDGYAECGRRGLGDLTSAARF